MSAYITSDDLLADIPESQLIDATDDDKDGEADGSVVTGILEQASREVDEYLEARFTVPVSPVPALVKNAARLFGLRKVFGRRGVAPDQLPFKDELERVTKQLEAIRDGELGLPGASGTSNFGAVTDTMATEGSTL